jgi:hypothetical protein
VQHLRRLSGDVRLTISKVEPGSVKLNIESSEEGFQRIKSLLAGGGLHDVLGLEILGIELDQEARAIRQAADAVVATAPHLVAIPGQVAGVVINFKKPELFSPLPEFRFTHLLAKAASNEVNEELEPGTIDFLPTEQLPAGASVEVFGAEVLVLVPCQDAFELEPPRVELRLATGEVLSITPECQERFAREIAGDPGSQREKPCWVAHFEKAPEVELALSVALPQAMEGEG